MSLFSMLAGQVANPVAGGASNPMVQAVVGMLAQSGPSALGGLGQLTGMFQQAGLGHLMESWIGTGANLPISPQQLVQVLGNDKIMALAGQFGLSPDQVVGQLTHLLPSIIDHLTPHGQAPQGGLGDATQIISALSGLFGK